MSRRRWRLAVGLIGFVALTASASLALSCADLSGLTSGEAATDGAPGGDAFADGAIDGAAPDGSPCAANLSSDPKSCGRCGRDCLGTPCTAGACETVVLADGLKNPNAMALGSSDVYVTTSADRRVWSIPKTGGSQIDLANDQPSVRGVALSGTTLFWTNPDVEFDDAGAFGGVWSCQLPKCEDRTLVSPQSGATALSVGGGTVYFGGGDGLYRAPAEGGAPTVVSSVEPFATAVDDQAVYQSGLGALLRTLLVDGGTGKPEALLVGQDSVGFITLDEARIYWAFANKSGGHVISLGKATPGLDAISYGVAGESVTPTGVAVDDAYVYWSTGGTSSGSTPNGDGRVLACPKKGCSPGGPIVLATSCYGGGPLLADAKELYWLEVGSGSNGRLRKVAKP